MADLLILSSNRVSKNRFFRAGGIRFIADVLPYLSKRYDVEFYVAGDEKNTLEFGGTEIHLVKTMGVPIVEKGILPPLEIEAEVVLFLDYGAALSPNKGRKNVIVFHHLARSLYDENPTLFRKYFGLLGLAYLRVEPILLKHIRRKAPVALAVSNVTPPYLEGYGYSVHLVGNGIDVGRYRPKKKEDYAVVLGRLVGYKRHEWAIEVAKQTGIPLKVVGTGPLERRLRESSPENVEFLGYLGEDEKVELLSRAKYLFSFSAFEGFNLSLIEAMACGTVPIVSRNKAHEFVLEGGRGGVLVNSSTEAVKALEELENDTDRYNELARSGREIVVRRWNAELVAQNYIRVIDSLIENINNTPGIL